MSSSLDPTKALPALLADRISYALLASRRGGVTVLRRLARDVTRASLTSMAVAPGNTDHSRAAAPVTNGAATLVPDDVTDVPSGARLATPSPGAPTPRLPIERPRFDCDSGRPVRA